MTITRILTLPFGDPFTHFRSEDGYGVEQWLAEFTIDLATYGDAPFAVSLAAEIKAAGGIMPTFRIRMGGTSQAADGVEILTIVPETSPADWTAVLATAARAASHGLTLFKLTVQNPADPWPAGMIEIPGDLAGIADGDGYDFPTGTGVATKRIEYQVTNGYAATPGAVTVDIRGAADWDGMRAALQSAIATVSTVNYEHESYGGGTYGLYLDWPTKGSAGNVAIVQLFTHAGWAVSGFVGGVDPRAIDIASAGLTLGFGDAPILTTTTPLWTSERQDIWFDALASDGEPNTMVTPSGDWVLVSGRVALAQSLTRRFLTSPGEWKTKPRYGAGLREACRKRGRQIDLDALANAMKEQAMMDSRVESVAAVRVDRIDTNGFKFTVTVVMKGDKEPLTFGGDVQP